MYRVSHLSSARMYYMRDITLAPNGLHYLIYSYYMHCSVGEGGSAVILLTKHYKIRSVADNFQTP